MSTGRSIAGSALSPPSSSHNIETRPTGTANQQKAASKREVDTGFKRSFKRQTEHRCRCCEGVASDLQNACRATPTVSDFEKGIFCHWRQNLMSTGSTVNAVRHVDPDTITHSALGTRTINTTTTMNKPRQNLDQLFALDAILSVILGSLALLSPHGVLTFLSGGFYNHSVHETLRSVVARPSNKQPLFPLG